jgi:hypothetical protein
MKFCKAFYFSQQSLIVVQRGEKETNPREHFLLSETTHETSTSSHSLILVYSSFFSFEAAAAHQPSQKALDNSDAIDPAFFLASAMAILDSFFFKSLSGRHHTRTWHPWSEGALPKSKKANLKA